MKIVVIIPALNEATSIGNVIKKIPRKIHPENEVAVIVVDDGSKDNTSEKATENGVDLLVKHRINRGIANAFKSGVRAALGINADIIVNIDADGQFDPHEIFKLVKPIFDGEADVVLGSRFCTEEDAKRVPIVKRMGNALVTMTVSLLSGQKFTDTQCGFRAITRRAALEMNVTGLFTYTQEMILDLVKKGFRVKEVPISVRYFADRSSRVVSSLPKYAAKSFGIIFFTILRVHSKSIAAVFLTQIIFILLLYLLFL